MVCFALYIETRQFLPVYLSANAQSFLGIVVLGWNLKCISYAELQIDNERSSKEHGSTKEHVRGIGQGVAVSGGAKQLIIASSQ